MDDVILHKGNPRQITGRRKSTESRPTPTSQAEATPGIQSCPLRPQLPFVKAVHAAGHTTMRPTEAALWFSPSPQLS